MRSIVFTAAASLAAVLLASSAHAQTTLGCATGGPGGAFPTSGTGGGGVYPTTLPPFEFSATFNVTSIPAGATAVTEVKFLGMAHTYGADLSFVLEDPAGVKYMLWNQSGGGCDLSGDYACTGLGTTAFPACTTTLINPGSYSQAFGTWPSGTNAINNVDLSAVVPQTGAWKLYIYDWAGGDIGTLTSWEVCFGTPPPPPPPPPTPCNGTELDALPYLGGNGGSNGGQIFFDLNVVNPAGIDLSQIDLHSDDSVGQNFTVDIYTCPTTYVGNTGNSAVWTLQASGGGVLAGLGQPTLAEFPDFHLAPGNHGVTVIFTSGNAGHTYTNGNGANQIFTNADMTLSCGAAQNVPWDGAPFSPRVLNGTLRYNCAPAGPVTYCTSGTSTNGCNPTISATAQPSATFANACSIDVSGVDGQKTSLIFYGINNSGFTPQQWGVGSTSFLCVKAPTQRMNSQNTGGTPGQCNGAMTQNWNTFHGANPGALGAPFSAGQKVYAQAWYRDPAAVKTTNLSDALELTMAP